MTKKSLNNLIKSCVVGDFLVLKFEETEFKNNIFRVCEKTESKVILESCKIGRKEALPFKFEKKITVWFDDDAVYNQDKMREKDKDFPEVV